MLSQVKAVAVDGGGVSDAVIEMLLRFFKVIPVPISAGGSVAERNSFVSIGKSVLIELILKAGVSVAEEASGREELKAEMVEFAVKVGAKGNLKMEARSGSHDDMVAARGLAILDASLSMPNLVMYRQVRLNIRN